MNMNKNENFENMIMRNVTKKMINESSYEPLLKKYLIKKSWYGDCTVKQLVDNFNNIATFIRFDLSKADYIKDWTIELLEKAVKMLEENEKEIILLKEIASKLNDKLNDTKIIIK